MAANRFVGNTDGAGYRRDVGRQQPEPGHDHRRQRQLVGVEHRTRLPPPRPERSRDSPTSCFGSPSRPTRWPPGSTPRSPPTSPTTSPTPCTTPTSCFPRSPPSTSTAGTYGGGHGGDRGQRAGHRRPDRRCDGRHLPGRRPGDHRRRRRPGVGDGAQSTRSTDHHQRQQHDLHGRDGRNLHGDDGHDHRVPSPGAVRRRRHPADRGDLPSTTANGTATLAGTPAAGTGGTYPFTITAHSTTAPDATQAFTLTVNRGAVASPAPTRATFTVGSAGTFTVTTGPRLPGGDHAVRRGGRLADRGDLRRQRQRHGHLGGHAGGRHRRDLPVHHHRRTTPPSPERHPAFTLTVNEAPSITSANSATFTVGTAGQLHRSRRHGFPAPDARPTVPRRCPPA